MLEVVHLVCFYVSSFSYKEKLVRVLMGSHVLFCLETYLILFLFVHFIYPGFSQDKNVFYYYDSIRRTTLGHINFFVL